MASTRVDDETVTGDVTPAADDTSHIGTDALRFNRIRATNVVAGDLHLKDEARGAHWKIREEADRIVVINEMTGKRYAMALTPIDDKKEQE